jgi:hypothetical protein
MREPTDKLIDRLAAEAHAVRPLRAPLLRAAAFLTTVAAIMAALALAAGHVNETLAHLAHMPFTAELAGALLAGAGAIVAAVMTSIPGRSPNWFYLPFPGIALWLVGGSLECYRQVTEFGYTPTSLLASQDCFTFIMSAGLPTAIAAYVFLRRTLSIGIAQVLALAGLGAALLAATLLQLVHAHGTNPVDFITHVVAVALLTLFAMLAARINSSAYPQA